MHAPDFQTGILGGLWGFIAAASSVLGRMQRRARAHQSSQHLRSQHRGHRIHHVRVVPARRHHAPHRRQPVLADLSGRHLRDQTGLARRHHGDPGAMARLLRDAGPVGFAGRPGVVPWRRPPAACRDDRRKNSAAPEAAHRAGMVCRGAAAKNPDRAGARNCRSHCRRGEAGARGDRADRRSATSAALRRARCSA